MVTPVTTTASAIDLFCGAGGLTCGLIAAGLRVVAGVDIDEACRFPFEQNNLGARFINRDLSDVDADEIAAIYPSAGPRVLVGCAPCQPFSTYSRRRERTGDADKWRLLAVFSRLVAEVRPEVVSMENVPQLTRHKAYRDFVEVLEHAGYHVGEPIITYGPDYGLPQERKRLIFFASLLGPVEPISMVADPASYRTLKNAIGHLEAIKAGGQSSEDPLHKSCTLSKTNMRRIKAAIPGGSWRDWPKQLVADCHKKHSGGTYPSVYGRMEWNKPAPTITTQFYGFGNGRFGHPEQDRAISLREGAIIQDFPYDYQFVAPNDPVCFRTVGRLIGNAVPVSLGKLVGSTLIAHLNSYAKTQD